MSDVITAPVEQPSETALDLPMAPKGGLTAFVEGQIKTALMAGSLKPGDQLVIRSLASQLGVSTTPVREALLRLAARNVLSLSHASSFRVPTSSRDEFSELTEIRKTLEGRATEIAATKITPAEIDALEKLFARARQAMETGDYAAALARNHEARFFLYRLAQMPSMLEMIETLWLRVGPILAAYFDPPETGGGTHFQSLLLASLRFADPAGARHALEMLITGSAQNILCHYAAQPD